MHQSKEKKVGSLVASASPKISAFPVRRGEFPLGQEKLQKGGMIPVSSGDRKSRFESA